MDGGENDIRRGKSGRLTCILEKMMDRGNLFSLPSASRSKVPHQAPVLPGTNLRIQCPHELVAESPMSVDCTSTFLLRIWQRDRIGGPCRGWGEGVLRRLDRRYQRHRGGDFLRSLYSLRVKAMDIENNSLVDANERDVVQVNCVCTRLCSPAILHAISYT